MEVTPPSGHPLRPLGLGEILDRAVALCVRFLIPLTLVEAGSAVASYAYNQYTGTDLARFWSDVVAGIRAHAVIAAHPPGGTNALSLLILFVIEPLVGGALIAMTSALYLGLPTSLRKAYRTAWARALSLALITAVFFVGSLAFIVLVAVLVTFCILLASGFASAGGIWSWIALAVSVLFIVAATLALAIIVAAIWLAFSFAWIVCVVETASPARSIALTIRRLFAKDARSPNAAVRGRESRYLPRLLRCRERGRRCLTLHKQRRRRERFRNGSGGRRGHLGHGFRLHLLLRLALACRRLRPPFGRARVAARIAYGSE